MAYYFWQESRPIWSFRRPVMFLFALKLWSIFFVFRRWYVNDFLFRWQLRYFLDKIRLVFCSFLALFHGFLCFLAAFFKVLSSRSIKFVLSKNNYECFLNFIVQLCRFSNHCTFVVNVAHLPRHIHKNSILWFLKWLLFHKATHHFHSKSKNQRGGKQHILKSIYETKIVQHAL